MSSLLKRARIAHVVIGASLSMLLFTVVLAVVLLSGQNRLKIHGALYNGIKAANDLNSDILPPPLYLIETYLTVQQLLSDGNAADRQALLAHLSGLEKDFTARQAYWARQELSPGVREILDDRVIPDARAMFAAIRTRLIPALIGRHDDMRPVAAELAALYTRHRAGVDELVKRVNASVDRAETAATDTEQSYHRITWGILTLTLAVSVGSILLLLTMIVRPIRSMTAAMRSLAAGDTHTAIPGLGRSDEIGEMAHAVEVFRANAIERVRLEAENHTERQRAEKEKQAALMGMAETVEKETGSSLEQIRQRTAAMTGIADKMSASAARTGASAETAAAAAGQALANAQTVASAAEQLAASIREIGGQVSQSTAVVGRAVAAGTETRATIETLNQQVERIGVVADMISEIAAKTNLLALNATIEAARAGDAGKGFAVVASEVKQLAKQTARSTDEIGRHIAEVRSATNASVEAVTRIEQTITEVNTIAGSIAAAVEQQGAATTEIARNVAGTANAANEMTARTGEVSTEAGETGRYATDVRNHASGLNDAIDGLRRSVIRVVRTATTEVDRRADPRHDVDMPCQLVVGGQTHDATLIDLSDGGAHVRDAPALQIGLRGTLNVSAVGFALPFLVRGSQANTLNLAFVLDEALAARFKGIAARLGRSRAA